MSGTRTVCSKSASTDSCSGQSTVADILRASTAWSTPERSRQARSDSVLRLREASQKRAAARAITTAGVRDTGQTEDLEPTCEGPRSTIRDTLAPNEKAPIEDNEDAEEDYHDARSNVSFYTAPGSARSQSSERTPAPDDAHDPNQDKCEGSATPPGRLAMSPDNASSTPQSPSLQATDRDEACTEETSNSTLSDTPITDSELVREWRFASSVDIAEQIILGEAAYNKEEAHAPTEKHTDALSDTRGLQESVATACVKPA